MEVLSCVQAHFFNLIHAIFFGVGWLEFRDRFEHRGLRLKYP